MVLTLFFIAMILEISSLSGRKDLWQYNLSKFENHSSLITKRSPAVSSLIALNNVSFDSPLPGSYIG